MGLDLNGNPLFPITLDKNVHGYYKEKQGKGGIDEDYR